MRSLNTNLLKLVTMLQTDRHDTMLTGRFAIIIVIMKECQLCFLILKRDFVHSPADAG